MHKIYPFCLFFFFIPFIIFGVEKPDFSHTRDFCEAPFDLQLTTTLANGVIKYTIDGTKPGQNNGIIYDGPIVISKTTTVRSVTLLADSVSNVRTHSFLFLDDVIHQDNSGIPDVQHSQDHVYWTEEFDMTDVTQSEDEIKQALLDIPTMSISAPYDSLFGIAGILRGQNLMEGSGGKAGDPNDPDWHELVECSVEMIYPENEKYAIYKDWQENCGIKIQGGGGRWNNGYYDHKQTFTLEFKSRYGAGTLHNDIFMAAPFNRNTSPERFDKIILRAGHNKSWGADWDRENSVYTRDQFGRDLQLLMSGWGSHGTFIHLYINGKYWGLYNPCERMDDNAMSIYFGGEDDDYYFGKGKGGDQAGSDDRYDYLNGTSWTNRQLSELQEFLAIDEYIDLCLLYCYSNPGDGPQYYYGNRNVPVGPVYFTAWDIEDSFEGGSVRTGPPVSMETYNDGGDFTAYTRAKNNIDFKMKFADRAYKHCFNNGILTDDNAAATWDSLCTFIEKAILCEIARWGDERGFLYDYDHWHKEWQDVKSDIHGRASKLITALKTANMYPILKPPLLKIAGETISDSLLHANIPVQLEIQQVETSGTAYFTTDGTDPRRWDLTGEVSAAASEITDQSGIIAVNDAAVIKVRSKDGSQWSPLRELRIIPGSINGIEKNDDFLDSRSGFFLYQNYPNPFNPITQIKFRLPKSTHVQILVYDVLGKRIKTLLNAYKNAGQHNVFWNGLNDQNDPVSSGVYFYQLNTDRYWEKKKMLLVR